MPVERPHTPQLPIDSSYLRKVYDHERFKAVVAATTAAVQERLVFGADFQALAFRGSSGAAVAYPVFLATGVPIVHIRKDRGHSFSMVEGAKHFSRYAIIDDFVSSGETLAAIMKAVTEAARGDGYAYGGWPDANPVVTDVFLYGASGIDNGNVESYLKYREGLSEAQRETLAQAKWWFGGF